MPRTDQIIEKSTPVRGVTRKRRTVPLIIPRASHITEIRINTKVRFLKNVDISSVKVIIIRLYNKIKGL